MALKVGELFATMNLKDEGFNKGLDNASGSIMKGLAKFKLLEAGLGALGKGFSASVNAGKTFETSMSQLAATMGTTVDQIGDLETKAREMGASTKYTASEAAEGLNILAQAGLQAGEQIASIDTVLSLASAGAMDMATSAGYIATAVKGWGDSFDNSAKYADIMAKGATLANTSVSDLGDAMSGMAASANQYGQSAESTAVALLRLADQSITGTEAATGLKRAMQILYAPTASEKKVLDELGVSTYDASGEAKEFNEVIGELQTAMGKLSKEERNSRASALFGARGLSVYNAMAATSEETLTGFWQGISEASGSAAEQAATQIDNLEGDLAILGSAVEGLQISVYKSMNGMLRDTVKAATGIVDAIHKAYDEGFTPENVAGIVGQASDAVKQIVKGVASKLPSILKGIVVSIPELLKGAGDIAIILSDALFEAVNEALKSLGTMLPQLAPILLSSLSGLLMSVGRGLAGIFDTVIGGIASGLGSDEIGVNLQEMLDKVLGTTNGTITAQIGIDTEVDTQQAEAEITPKVTDALTGIFDGVKETLTNGILKDDAEATAAASEAMQAQIGELASNISTWEEAKIAAIKASGLENDSAIAEEIAAVQEQANAMREALDGAQTAAGEWLETYSEAPTKVVKDHMGELDEVVSSVSEVESQIGTLMDSLASEATVDEPEKSVGQQIVEDVIGSVDAEAVNGAFGGLGELVVNAINTGISSAIETVSSQDFAGNLSAVGTAIITGIATAITSVEGAATTILEQITGIINTALTDEGLGGMLNTASTVAEGIVTGIKEGLSSVGIATSELAGAVIDLIGTALDKITSADFVSGASKLAGTIVAGILSSLVTFTDAATLFVAGLSFKINEALTDERLAGLLTGASTIAESVFSAITAGINDLSTAGAGLVEAVGNLVLTGLQKITSEDFASGAATLAATVVTGIGTSISTLETGASTILDKITGLINSAMADETLSSALTGANTVAEAVLSTISTQIEGVTDGAATLAASVVKLVITGIGKITSADFTGKLGVLATTILTGIGTAIGKTLIGAANVTKAIKQVLQAALTPEKISAAIGNVATLGADIIGAIGTAISSAANGATSLVEAVSGLFSAIMSEENLAAYTEALRGLGGKLLGALTEAFGSVSEDAGDLGSAVITAIGKGIQGTFNGGAAILDAITGVLQDALSEGKISSILTNLGDFGTQILNAIGEGIKSAANGAVNFIGSIGELLKTALNPGENGETIIGSLSGLGQTIVTAIIKALNDVDDAAGSILGALGDLLGGIDWETVGIDLGNFATGIVSKIASEIGSTDFTQLASSLGGLLGNAVAGIANGALGIAKALIGWVLSGEVFTALYNIVKSLLEAAWGFFTNMFSTIWDKSWIGQQISELIYGEGFDFGTEVKLDFDTGVPQMDEFAGRVMRELVTALQYQENSDKTADEFFNQFIQDHFGKLTDAQLAAIHQLGLDTALTDEIRRVIDSTFETQGWGEPVEAEVGVEPKPIVEQTEAEALAEQIRSQVETEMNLSDETISFTPKVEVNSATTGEDSGLQSAADAYLEKQSVTVGIDAAASLNVTVSDSNATEVGTALGTDIGTAMTAAIEAATTGVSTAASGLATAAKKAISGLYSTAYNSGLSFGRGFVNGMSSTLKSVIATAQSMGDAAKNTLKRSIKQGSPSKITMESGGFFGEGFSLGIAGQIKAVTDTARDLAHSAVEAATVKRFNVGPASLAGATAGGGYMPIDYDRMADAMSERPQTIDMDGKTLARVQQKRNAKENNSRNRSVRVGYYGYGTTRR